MQPGGKYVDSNGNQIAIFPSLQLNVTQNPLGTFSHTDAKSMDNSCAPGKKRLYAPCDMVCVRHSNSGDGGVFYQTVKPVVTPSGLTHFSIYLCHDENFTQWVPGRVYRQGEHFYTEGMMGWATGPHVHYDVAFGHESTLWQLPVGTWEIRNSVFIDKVFFIDHTEILTPNAWGTGRYTLNWQYHKETTPYYNVVFYSNGGTPVKTQSIKKGDKAIKPTSPTKEGYTFIRWSYEDGTTYDFNTPVTSNLRLIAQWSKNKVPEGKSDIIPLYMMDIIEGGYNG